MKARFVNISTESSFLDVGWKSDAYLDSKWLLYEGGSLSVNEGGLIQAHFLASGEDGMCVSTQTTRGD